MEFVEHAGFQERPGRKFALLVGVKRPPAPVDQVLQDWLGFRLDLRHPAAVARGADSLHDLIERRLAEHDIPRLEPVALLLDPMVKGLTDRSLPSKPVWPKVLASDRSPAAEDAAGVHACSL
jgi:hypothetical protein